MPREGFTPTQQAMMNVLADGLPHTRQELHACLPDELAALGAIKVHVSEMRKVLNPKGLDIVCQNRYGIQYRLMRLLASPYTGSM